MRRLLTLGIILACLSLPAWAAITQNSGNKVNCTANTTCTITYSPAAGNRVVLWIDTGVAVGSLACADNNSNSLTAGPVKTNGVGINLAGFYGVAITGATGYTCTWTTSTTAAVVVEDYSGSSSFNASLAGNTASGTSTSATITVTTEDSNDWVVCGISDGINALTVTVGNSRQATTGGASKTVLLDNTVVSPGSVTCTATLTSSAWAAAVIELRTTGGGVVRHRSQVIQQ
jgi:nitrogen fixation protein FixH